VQPESSEGSSEPARSCISVDCDTDPVVRNTVDLRENTDADSVLYASGILWIDRAYEVVRQLRRNHGLREISSLVEPSRQSDE
jgi:hypothetical protein